MSDEFENDLDSRCNRLSVDQTMMQDSCFHCCIKPTGLATCLHTSVDDMEKNAASCDYVAVRGLFGVERNQSKNNLTKISWMVDGERMEREAHLLAPVDAEVEKETMATCKTASLMNWDVRGLESMSYACPFSRSQRQTHQ